MTTPTEALPLTNGIYNQIQFLLVQYMTTVHPWTRQIFGNAQYSYLKDDLASVQRPAVIIYPLNSQKNSWSYSYTGKVQMELHFSLKEYRNDLAQNVIQIANDIELINLNEGFTRYLQQYMSGLFWFGKEVYTDYSGVYSKESIVRIIFDFNVDLQAYQQELQAQGLDITSPDGVIYVPAQALLENLAVLNPDLSPAFVVN